MKPRYIIFVVIAFAALAPLAFAQTNSSFVPLTQIPAITQFANSPTNGTLVSFFNSLYEYCVGIAAALAVFMIIWAGVTWMTAGDSVEKISQAKKRIGNALFGLVLVLSPAIVFGIINPNVLTLNIDFSKLTPSTPSGAPAASQPSCPTGTAAVTVGSYINGGVPLSCCPSGNVVNSGKYEWCLAPGQTSPPANTTSACSTVTVGSLMPGGVAQSCCPSGNVVSSGKFQWCLAPGQTSPPAPVSACSNVSLGLMPGGVADSCCPTGNVMRSGKFAYCEPAGATTIVDR